MFGVYEFTALCLPYLFLSGFQKKANGAESQYLLHGF